MGSLILLEARVLLRDRVLLCLLAAYLLLVALAATGGHAAMAAAAQAQAVAVAKAEDAAARMARRLGEPMPAEDAVLTPVRVRSPIIAPVPRLLDFSRGRSGFEATSAEAGLRSRPETLFRQMRLDNPALLARGALDLGFIVVLVAPFLLVAVGAGLWAPDRDSGAARLALVQGGTALRLLAARSIPRLALVGAPVLLAAVVLLLTGPAVPGRGAAAAAWLATAFLWLLLCWALVVWIHSRRFGAETALFLALGVWAVFTLLLAPAVVTTAAALHPPPSPYAAIAAARAAEVAATQDWDNTHAEMEGDEAATRSASLRKGLAIAAATERAVAPIRAAHADALARQQALVRALSWGVPPLGVALALEDAAATGAAAAGSFTDAAEAHLAEVQAALSPLVREGRGLSADAYRQLPAFAWLPPPPRWAILPWLAILILVLLVPARRGFRRPLLA